MKKLVIIIVTLIAVIGISAILYSSLGESAMATLAESEQQSVVLPKLGVEASDFLVTDYEGNEYKLSDFEGKPVVINFWATWCGYCVQEMPAFDSLAEEYSDRVDFMMVDLTDGVRETKEAAARFIEKQGFGFPVYYDKDFSAATAYSIQSIPLSIFVDENGNLFKKHMGAMDEKNLRSYLEELTK